MPKYIATEPVFVNDFYINEGGEFEVPEGTPIGRTWVHVEEDKPKGKQPAAKADEALA